MLCLWETTSYAQAGAAEHYNGGLHACGHRYFEPIQDDAIDWFCRKCLGRPPRKLSKTEPFTADELAVEDVPEDRGPDGFYQMILNQSAVAQEAHQSVAGQSRQLRESLGLSALDMNVTARVDAGTRALVTGTDR